MPIYLPPLETSGTTLPSAPYDGQIYNYLADDTNGVVWRFKFRAASASTYKWEFVGGMGLYSAVNNAGYPGTAQTTTSTTYVDLATSGPSVTPPRDGDYFIEHGFQGNNGTGDTLMSFAIGGTAAVDADCIWRNVNANYLMTTRIVLKTGLVASAALLAKYRVTGGTADFRNRYMRLTPVRVI